MKLARAPSTADPADAERTAGSEGAAMKLARAASIADPADAERTAAVIVEAATRVHAQLGPGLLESTYETCLAHELVCAGHLVERQRFVPVVYRGVRIDRGYRLDLLVDGAVIVEIKAVDNLCSVQDAQLLTYLRLSGITLGLLINFNVGVLRHGVRRVEALPRPSHCVPTAANHT
jgi:GxxExxY protein